MVQVYVKTIERITVVNECNLRVSQLLSCKMQIFWHFFILISIVNLNLHASQALLEDKLIFCHELRHETILLDAKTCLKSGHSFIRNFTSSLTYLDLGIVDHKNEVFVWT